LLAEPAAAAIRGFVSRMRRGRPWVRAKVAASLDGRTALANGVSRWITGSAARADVHRWRARSSVVLTGIGTILADDPRLDARPGDLEWPMIQPARVVLIAGYTYENVRLLLLSKSAAYPDGLSNNHGQVGRHYLSHHQGAGVSALFPFDLGSWYGLPAQGVAVDEWADDNFDHADLDFIGGGNLWAMSDNRPISAASSGTFGRSRGWGSDWKRFIHENADRSHGFYIQKTTLPHVDNYLDLDPTVKDALGFPVIRITGQYKENELRIAAFLQDKAEEWYRAAGATEVARGGLGNQMGASTHAYGGTRMGDDPETNVVDRWGFSHEARNVGVLGASVMGTSGARNPTLTAQALAWRTAAHLAESWSDIAG